MEKSLFFDKHGSKISPLRVASVEMRTFLLEPVNDSETTINLILKYTQTKSGTNLIDQSRYSDSEKTELNYFTSVKGTYNPKVIFLPVL